MLKSIKINNFAIISEIELNFESGLNVFTGETGAGKSIVIEALGFVLGARGDAGLIRSGADKIIVNAVFDSGDLPGELKEKYQINSPQFAIKRELDRKGKSRAWINNLNVLISDLNGIGGVLVDFHGQHEHQSLFKPSVHLDILDDYAGLGKTLNVLRVVYNKVQDIKNKIAALQMSAEEKSRALDLYKYQLDEIEKTAPRPNEDSEIEALLPKLKHAAKLKEHAEEAYEILSGMENAACGLLSKAARLLEDMSGFDSSLSEAAGEISSALASAEDAAATLSSYKDSIEADPSALDDMLARQETLRKLKLKYGATIESALAFTENLKKRINDLQSGDENIQKLETELAIALKKLLSLSDGLYAQREKAARKLSALVAAEVSPLGFEQVRFEAAIEHTRNIGHKGADSVEFLFSSNPGSALRPLRNIASGGEISRLMLGFKTVLNSGTPVMVFDEIDAGISGHTGKLVGQKLKKVSEGRQVLCVTHLPQVAAYADRHFSVAKVINGKNTDVKVEVLEEENKAMEIARMIGSSQTASAGYRHAQDLLREAGNKFKG
ncbi:MAG: DNA repair protein RecN [Elusimicrobiota bacterium]|jgi:DNA repair protein RecN (Recombination protein N)|nr:DNA repair protein RecN [Elusimicrobiota bacterium]